MSIQQRAQCTWTINDDTIEIFNDKYYTTNNIQFKLNYGIYVVSYNTSRHIKYKYVSLLEALKNFNMFMISNDSIVSYDDLSSYLDTIACLFYESDLGHIIPNNHYILILYDTDYREKIKHDIENDILYFFYYPSKNIKLEELTRNDIKWLEDIKSECVKFMKTMIADSSKIMISYVDNEYGYLSFRIDMIYNIMAFSHIIRTMPFDLIIAYIRIFGDYFFYGYKFPYNNSMIGGNTIDNMYNYNSHNRCDTFCKINEEIFDIRHYYTPQYMPNGTNPFYIKRFPYKVYEFYINPIKSSITQIANNDMISTITNLISYKHHKIQVKIEPIIKIDDNNGNNMIMPLYACIHNKDKFFPYNIDYFYLGVICTYGINHSYVKTIMNHSAYIKFVIDNNIIIYFGNYIYSISNYNIDNFNYKEQLGFILYIDKDHIKHNIDKVIDYIRTGDIQKPLVYFNDKLCIYKTNGKFIYNTFREIPYDIFDGYDKMISKIKSKFNLNDNIRCNFHYPNSLQSLFTHLNITTNRPVFNKGIRLLRFHDLYNYDSYESYITNIDYYFIKNMYEHLIRKGVNNILYIPLYQYYKRQYIEYYCEPQDKIKKYIDKIYGKNIK